MNPFKDPSLHATMEGWIGIDKTFNDLAYFPRTTDCPAGTGYGMHCGVTQAEAEALGYVSGAGYGNNWHVCIGHSFDFTGSTVTLTYDYLNETEENYDFSSVVVDTVGDGDPAHDVTAVQYTGTLSGSETLDLQAGQEMPAGPRNGILVKFCFDSDEVWSDEDGLNSTTCGAFSVDNVALSGGIESPLQDFESGDGGWVVQPAQPGQGGDWSHLVPLSSLPAPLTYCACDLRDSVLVFEDTRNGGHPAYQDNLAASPWIDLRREGLAGRPGKFVEAHTYLNLPLLNYLFAQFEIQYALQAPDGPWITSRWIPDGFVYNFHGFPTCTDGARAPERIDFSADVDPGAEQVRVAVGAINLCRFFDNCTGITNSTPWFDRVRYGVFGTPGTPILSAEIYDLPQDAFPEAGGLDPFHTVRVDCGTVKGAASPEPFTSLGDTLIVHCGAKEVEIRVQFAVRPGPGTNPTALQQFLSRVRFEETRRGRNWYSARMDTAEVAGSVAPGRWMTAFHEEDPAFGGSDTDLDFSDPDPFGHFNRLENDIFPDNLLTPGARLELFYTAGFLGSSVASTFPDTSGGNYLEMEGLPSSMEADGTHNSVLYVDHCDGSGAQSLIERGLDLVLPGGSANAENTAWDRWDVRASGTSYSFFGRPSECEFGASLVQLLGYGTVLWSTGDMTSYSLRQEDADVLVPWLTYQYLGDHALYLTGDGLVQSVWTEAGIEPHAQQLLTDQCGVSRVCDTFAQQDCPPGSPLDQTPCPLLDPVLGARVAWVRSAMELTHYAQGNACPERRSFDVLVPNPAPTYGNPLPDEQYVGAEKTVAYASVSNLADQNGTHTRTLVDGVSVNERRDPSDCNAAPASALPQAVLGRLTEALQWMRASGGNPVGIDPPAPAFTTALLGASPNPLRRGAGTRIRFTLEREGRVALSVYDLRGARVRRLLDGPGQAGENEAVWDGKDAAGRPVAQGIYFYRLDALGKEFHRKLVVLGH